MFTNTDVLERMWGMCLSLPDTKETMTWGSPHFRVGEKIFAGLGEEEGRPILDFKLEMDHAHAVIRRPEFTKAKYVGHKGWVSLDASQVKDWGEVEAMIRESYRLIAPKRSLAKLDDGVGTSPPGREKKTTGAIARKK